MRMRAGGGGGGEQIARFARSPDDRLLRLYRPDQILDDLVLITFAHPDMQAGRVVGVGGLVEHENGEGPCAVGVQQGRGPAAPARDAGFVAGAIRVCMSVVIPGRRDLTHLRVRVHKGVDRDLGIPRVWIAQAWCDLEETVLGM